MRLMDGRRRMDDTTADNPNYLKSCRDHIEFVKEYRAYMRIWLRKLDEHFKGKAANVMPYQPYG